MSVLSDIGPLLVVALGSLVLMAGLTSVIRYRRLELIAREEKESGSRISAPALVVYLLSLLRKENRIITRIDLPGRNELVSLREFLLSHTREGDEHFLLEGGSLVSAFICESDQAEPLASRLQRVLKDQGQSEGTIQVLNPGLHAGDLLTWIKAEPLFTDGEVTVSITSFVEVPQTTPETPSSVDRETGVYRMELISKVIRRQLAESKRRSRPAVLIRLSAAGKDSLSALAEVLMEGFRETDLIGRSGDQEFVLCLETSLERGEKVAERLYDMLLKQGWEVQMGLAAMPEHGSNPGQLFERAGVALLQAGEMEGCSVCMYTEHRETPEMAEAEPSFGKEIF